MKVILTETVSTLGNIGEIVNVSAGHARNFLIPGRKAVLADDSNRKQLDNEKRRLAKRMQEAKDAATSIKTKIEGLTLTFVKKVGGTGKLFGTVTTAEISKMLADNGADVEKRLLLLDSPIKSLGTFGVKAKLFQDVEASFEVKVEMDPKQLEEIKAKQAAAAEKKANAAAKAETEGEATEAAAEETETKKEETDDERLAREAQEILRS